MLSRIIENLTPSGDRAKDDEDGGGGVGDGTIRSSSKSRSASDGANVDHHVIHSLTRYTSPKIINHQQKKSIVQ